MGVVYREGWCESEAERVGPGSDYTVENTVLYLLNHVPTAS